MTMRAFSTVLAVSLFGLALVAGADNVGETRLVFTGDILLDRGVRTEIARHGADHLFTEAVDSVFRSADVVVGNLECPATEIKAPVHKKFIFRAEPQWLHTLKQHGFTHLNLANNHSIDQGRRGLMDTRRNIIKAGMVPVGADSTMVAASQPVLLTQTPRKVWLVASLRLALENYTYLPAKPCVSQEPMDSLLMQVSRIKKDDPSAVVIVSFHWGGEHTLEPVPSQRLEARRLIDAGADALICHHTHTLQSVEHYRGKPIYYSIGNFIFDQQKPLNSKAAMVQLIITAADVQEKMIPVEIRRCVPYIIENEN